LFKVFLDKTGDPKDDIIKKIAFTYIYNILMLIDERLRIQEIRHDVEMMN
jgi:hypothetical protein